MEQRGHTDKRKTSRFRNRLVTSFDIDHFRLITFCPMPVAIKIHPIYRIFTDNKSIVYVDGTNVENCLKDLVQKFPELQKELFNEDGTLSVIPVIFKNNMIIKDKTMLEPVHSTDIIRVDLFLAGG